VPTLRRNLGLSLLVLGLLVLGCGTVVMIQGDPKGAGLLVATGAAVVLVVPGHLLRQSGERGIARAEGEFRVRAAGLIARRFAKHLPDALARASAEVPPPLKAGLQARVRAGTLPLEPLSAGLACLFCATEGELRSVTLRRHGGIPVLRNLSMREARLCRHCLLGMAEGGPSRNPIADAWGPLSVAPGLEDLPTLGVPGLPGSHRRAAEAMTAPDPWPRPTTLDAETLDRLRPFVAAVARMLVDGAEPETVFRTTAAKTGVTPGQVLLLVTALAGQAEVPAAGGDGAPERPSPTPAPRTGPAAP
jgi:hypothetical protein